MQMEKLFLVEFCEYIDINELRVRCQNKTALHESHSPGPMISKNGTHFYSGFINICKNCRSIVCNFCYDNNSCINCLEFPSEKECTNCGILPWMYICYECHTLLPYYSCRCKPNGTFCLLDFEDGTRVFCFRH